MDYLKKNKKLIISQCNPLSRSSMSQTIGVEILCQNRHMVERYRIVVSEPANSNCKNIEQISNKFQDLFYSLNEGR